MPTVTSVKTITEFARKDSSRFSGSDLVVESLTVTIGCLAGLLTVSQRVAEEFRWSLGCRASFSLSGACECGFDNAADGVEIFDPRGIQPEILAAFHAACTFVYFFFRNIFSQRVV